jgi:predicted HicB family RNase H-like nuclease
MVVKWPLADRLLVCYFVPVRPYLSPNGAGITGATMTKRGKVRLSAEFARELASKGQLDYQIKLRLSASLHDRLVEQAQLHARTLNAEVGRRLEDSFEQGARRTFEAISTEMHVAWGRWAGRLLTRVLADELADAVLRDGDPARLRTLAQLVVEQRNIEQHGMGGRS